MNDLEKILTQYEKAGLWTKGGITDYELITFTFHSTTIEGSSLTYDEVYALLNDKVAAPKPMEHNQMNIDHAEAYLFGLKQLKKKQVLTIDFIRAVCGKVKKNTGVVYNTVLGSWDESNGDIRLGAARVGKRYFPDAKKVPRLMGQMMDEFNKRFSKLKTKEEIFNLSCDVHYNLVAIHPFSDGNGRTARILANAVLYAYDLPRMILLSATKPEYYKSLERTAVEEDIGVFRNFMKEQYTLHLKREIEAVNLENKDKSKGMYFTF